MYMSKYKKPEFKEYGNSLFDIKTSYNSNSSSDGFNLEKFCIGFGVFVVIAIVCAIIYFIVNGNSFKNHNNGICDYCSKQAEHRLGDEEFCDDHYIDRMGDIIEWSSEKNK